MKEGMAIRAMVIVNGATVAFENVEFENTVKKRLYLENSTSTIANSTFRNNVTDYDGAGLYKLLAARHHHREHFCREQIWPSNCRRRGL